MVLLGPLPKTRENRVLLRFKAKFFLMTCPIIGMSFVVVYNHGQSLIIPTKYVTFGITGGHNLPIECIAEVLYSMALPSRVCWFALFAYRLNKSV